MEANIETSKVINYEWIAKGVCLLAETIIYTHLDYISKKVNRKEGKNPPSSLFIQVEARFLSRINQNP